MPSDSSRTYAEDILGTKYPYIDLKAGGLSPFVSNIKRSF